MSVQQINPVVEKQARFLAQDNREVEPGITRVLWFPHENEVRLVEVYELIPEGTDGLVVPFYFSASPEDQVPAPFAIAMIRSYEVGKLKLPEGWGGWSDAIEL